MLTLKTLRDNPEMVVAKLAKKNFDAKAIVAEILDLDTLRRSLQTESDALKSAQNQMASRIGLFMKQGQKEEAEKAKAEVAGMKEKYNDMIARLDQAEKDMNAKIVLLPNLPCDHVPEGKGAEDNLVVKMGGPEVNLPENALPHWELAKKYDIIDFDLGVKITGAGFPVYKGKGAKLQRALINFFLDCNTAAGYQETEPPVVVNAASGFPVPEPELSLYFIFCFTGSVYSFRSSASPAGPRCPGCGFPL